MHADDELRMKADAFTEGYNLAAGFDPAPGLNPYVPKRVNDFSAPPEAVVLAVIEYDDDTFNTWRKEGLDTWTYLNPEGGELYSLPWDLVMNPQVRSSMREIVFYYPAEVR